MQYITKLSSCILIIVLLCFSYSFAQDSKKGTDQKTKYYTAYNIWKWPSYHMKCINYKGGLKKVIPVGTEVSDPKIIKVKDDFGDYIKVIRFKTINNKKVFKIIFTKRYHPGKSINDYLAYMFTTKKFEELTAGLSDNEISAIKSGAILDGMSKEAVLICYGPPPEHATQSLDSRVWTYWKNKKNREKITFNSNNRTGPENIQKTEIKIEEKIVLLKGLLDKGLITQEEYNKKKSDLLERF